MFRYILNIQRCVELVLMLALRLRPIRGGPGVGDTIVRVFGRVAIIGQLYLHKGILAQRGAAKCRRGAERKPESVTSSTVSPILSTRVALTKDTMM